MLDRFIYGSVERISPEGPIPVLRVEQRTSVLGGAGNVVRNLKAIGSYPRFLSVVGDDQEGKEVRALAIEELGDSKGILGECGRSTTVKHRYIASGQQLLRVDREDNKPLAQQTALKLEKAAIKALTDVDLVILSDYGKGVLERELVSTIIDSARQVGRPVIVDPKGRDYSVYRGAEIITPNKRELHEATGLPVSSDDDVAAACNHVIDSCGVGAVLATRGDEGVTLVSSKNSVIHQPSRALDVYDVSGAGDTVVAIVGAGLSVGLSLDYTIHLANLAGGIVVGKVGTALVSPSDLRRALDSEVIDTNTTKLVDQDRAIEDARRWRANHLTVGFTNGCFDLLHPGHIAVLVEARAACDRLIVGLNGDESVKRLKGNGRPVQGEAARAAVLASLEAVDRIVFFDEDTPAKIIEALKPHLLVKGSDYSPSQVVGASTVESYGGRVLIVDRVPGFATSSIIRKMSKN
jgi:D-beta-D-heptose 7-phosphate kinase/D-beta-D-heptose 1-phosphate adenosyltransferase